MTKIAGSESGSISQKHGSEDPDPPQNVMVPEHWLEELSGVSQNLIVLFKVVRRNIYIFF
jgi:hypothetical protein